MDEELGDPHWLLKPGHKHFKWSHTEFQEGASYVDYAGTFTVLKVYRDSMRVQYSGEEPVVLDDLSYRIGVVRKVGGETYRGLYLSIKLSSASLNAAVARMQGLRMGLYYVYVIRLRDSARRDRRVTYLGRRGMPCVYVGQTGKTVAERFADHLNGHKTNIRPYVLELLPELYEEYNPLPSREQAETVEAVLGEYLFSQGYTVLGGH